LEKARPVIIDCFLAGVGGGKKENSNRSVLGWSIFSSKRIALKQEILSALITVLFGKG
jgi:hypothetical protein